MSDGNDGIDEINSARQDRLLAAYEFAREERDCADVLLWEVAAIIWGGQTLLLGFALEAVSVKDRAPAVIVVLVGVVGIVMAVINDLIMRTRSGVCHAMVDLMQDLETKLNMEIKPQHILTEGYKALRQRICFWILNYFFALAWVIFIFFVLCTFAHNE